VIREKVPFPASLGRVCFQPCEQNCRRGEIDDAVSICRLERFVADEDKGFWQEKLPKAEQTGKKLP
jgi:formate dehydrogenase (NADP+) beta subunit